MDAFRAMPRTEKIAYVQAAMEELDARKGPAHEDVIFKDAPTDENSG
jgi:hypothetical protein